MEVQFLSSAPLLPYAGVAHWESSRLALLGTDEPWGCKSPRRHHFIFSSSNRRTRACEARNPGASPGEKTIFLLPKRRQRRIALVMRGVRRTSGWELQLFSAWWNLYHTRLRTSGSGRESRRGVHFPLEGKAAEVRCPVGNRRERLQRFRGRTGAFRHFRFGG